MDFRVTHVFPWKPALRVPLSAKGLWLLTIGLSAVGYVLCLEVLLRRGIYGAGGAGGVDVLAYFTAGHNLATGNSVYGPSVGGYAAYLYPPPLAQLFAPFSSLGFPAVVWIWRVVEVLCLRLAVGSWRAAGLAILLWPPVIAELDAGNVHLLIAAAIGTAVRGRPALVMPFALTKFATLVAIPIALRDDARGLGLGAAVAGLLVLISFALNPSLWLDYAHFMTGVSSFYPGWYDLGATIPLPLRLVVAAAAAVAALRWTRLAVVASTLALPVLWFHGLSTLVAIVARPHQRAAETLSS